MTRTKTMLLPSGESVTLTDDGYRIKSVGRREDGDDALVFEYKYSDDAEVAGWLVDLIMGNDEATR